MSEHLWPLLRLKTADDEELKEKYRQVYLETYVRDADGNEIELYDWTGKRVYFHEPTFDHAFSESSDYRRGDGIHDIPLSKNRAQRILWIKEVLQASRGNIERRSQIRNNTRGAKVKRRSLIVIEERYVVVLQERDRDHQLEFVTAIPADHGYIEKLKRESVLQERKMPQSFGD